MSPFTIDNLIEIRRAVDAHAPLFAGDLQDNIVHANDKFCDISGYSREELTGANHRILKSGIHPVRLFVSFQAFEKE